MATSTVVLIVIAAVVAILLIAGLTWVARNKRNQHRHVDAEKIREDARQETLHVKQHEALADETAAKARTAQADRADTLDPASPGSDTRGAAHDEPQPTAGTR
jgi:FtsZ-interacting cell division protein ZipA